MKTPAHWILFLGLLHNQAAAAVDCRTVPLTAGSSYDCTLGSRRYLLHLPPQFQKTKSYPVVLNLHGGGHNPEGFESLTAIVPNADQRGLVVVAPEGLEGLWNAGSCCGASAIQAVDDVGFIRSVLDQVSSILSVDSRRVFALGLSNGAMMAHRLGCEMSDRIAAIAPVSGGLQNIDETGKVYFDCLPAKPVSILEINGKADLGYRLQGVDTCAPYEGGFTTLDSSETPYRRSIEASFNQWKTANGCSSVSSRKTIGSGSGRFECTQYSACANGSAASLCTIPNGAHWWPGAASFPASVALACGRGVVSPQSATSLALDFFLAHPR